MPVRTPALSWCDKIARMTFCHGTYRKNVKFRWKSAILSEFDQYRAFAHITWPFHNKSSPISTLVWNFNHALVGVYRECKYKLLNFFYYPSISYKSENNPSCHVTWWRIATDRWKSAKWSNFAKNRSLTFVTPSQHVNTNRHKCPSSIDWKCHFAFIIPRMMRKSTLVLPVEYQNQARPIESAEPSSFSLISLNASQNPRIIMMW